jgi:hypothetical protein
MQKYDFFLGYMAKVKTCKAIVIYLLSVCCLTSSEMSGFFLAKRFHFLSISVISLGQYTFCKFLI